MPNFFIGKDHKICRSEESDVVLDTAVRFSTLDEFRRVASDLALSQLLAMWNELPGVRTISRFENRTIAVDRIWRALTRPDEPMPGRQHRVKRKRVRRKRQPKAELILTCCAGRKAPRLKKSETLPTGRPTAYGDYQREGIQSARLSRSVVRRDGQRVYVISETPRKVPRFHFSITQPRNSPSSNRSATTSSTDETGSSGTPSRPPSRWL